MTLRTTGRLATVLLLAGALGVAAPAFARDVEDMRVSGEEPVDEKTYDPIVGQNTSLLHRPEDCRTAAYCDVIDLEIDLPDDLDENDLHKVVVTLTWEDVADDADLDLYLYDPEGRRHDESATADPEEKADFTQPSEDTWFIVINNFAGAHQSYTVKAEFVVEDLPPIPELAIPTAPPDPEPAETPTPPPAQPVGDTAGTPSNEAATDTGPTPEPIITPGPDGAPREVALSSVPGSGAPLDEGGGWGWVLPVGVGIGLGSLGVGAYLIRRRHLSEAS